MKKGLKTVLIIILLIVLFGGSFYFYKHYFQKKPTSLSSNLPGKLIGPKASTRAEKLAPEKVIYWTNKYRTDNGLAALTENTQLTQAAEKKTLDMFEKQYFEHNAPNGTTPSDLVSSTGYQYKTTGENLALGDFKDEKDLVDAWMASPGHRANILNSEYTEIGVATGLGHFEDRDVTWLAVQEFGRPLPNCTKPDENISNNIENKKADYLTLAQQTKGLSTEGNSKIEQGNTIYANTGDKAQAQPYWDEGTALQAQAKDKETEAYNFQQEITALSDEYNAQVSTFNDCIKK